MSCVLVSCLLALHTPALAIATYDVFVQTSVSAPGPLPSGTSLFFLPGSTSSFHGSTGNGIATAVASVSPPGSATALVTGFTGASGPNGGASGFAEATSQANLTNLNATTVTFPLTFAFSRHASASVIPTFGQTEHADLGFASFSVVLDHSQLLTNSSGLCAFGSGNCDSFDSGSDAFLFGLTPGPHSLWVTVDVSASAVSFSSPSPISPTPEPASLLLMGTSMAGLGLGWWRRQRRH